MSFNYRPANLILILGFISFQVCCAQQQLTSVCHLRVATVPRVLTIWMTTCACALKDQFGSWARTVKSCWMPASLHHAPTAPAFLGLINFPATVQMVSRVLTALSIWMNVRVTHVMASGHFASTGPRDTPVTVPLDSEDKPAWKMSPHAQKGSVSMVAFV